MDLQHAPSPQRTGTYIHELRTREGRRALAGAVPGLQCPSWDWPGTSAGRTAESTVRPMRSAPRVHPAKASDPAGSSRSQWPVASTPSPVSASAAFRRSSPVLVPESPARKAPKPSLALSARQARNFPKLNRCSQEERSGSERVPRANGTQAGWEPARPPPASCRSCLSWGLHPAPSSAAHACEASPTLPTLLLLGGRAPVACAAVATAALPTCQSLSGLLFNLVTHSPLDLLSWLFFFLFILFFKILSPNWPPLALLSVDTIAFAAVGNVNQTVEFGI